MLTRLLAEHDHIRKTLNLLEVQFLDLCRDQSPDFALMRSIIVYIQEYPEQAHHPLEDVMFSMLIERVKDSALLQQLITDHTELEVVTRTLRESLASIKTGEVTLAELKHQLSEFLTRQRRHLYIEEIEVFPFARRILTEKDWAQIQAVVPLRDDPVFGERTHSDYERLLQQVEKNSR